MSFIAPARSVAAKLLTQARTRDAYARDLMRTSAAYRALDARDQALCTRLVLGTVACRTQLDGLINFHATRPAAIEPKVRDVLRMATFELLHLDTPTRAVVHQAVNLAKTVLPQAAAFTNAILRSILAEDVPRFKQARAQVEAGSDDALALSMVAGTPSWMQELLYAQYGPVVASKIALGNLEPAPIYVACDTFAEDPDAWFSRLDEAGFAPCRTWLPTVARLQHTAGFASSDIAKTSIVSDLAAQCVAAVAVPGPGGRMLEIGQGRATKSLSMLSMARAAGWSFEMDGVDVSAYKTKIARERLAHTGAKIRVFEGNGCDLDAIEGLHGSYDTVFLDAPCSGTGTMRRHPEIAWSLELRSLAENEPDSLVNLQARLLAEAAKKTAVGGHLIYATCSIFKLEDRIQVEDFLATPLGSGFVVENAMEAPYAASLDSAESLEFGACVAPDGMFASVPVEGGCDGHFACRLLRVR